MLHPIIVPHYLTLFSALCFSMYLNILFYYYVLLPLILTIVMYYCILQAMYGPSLLNYCLLSKNYCPLSFRPLGAGRC